jgi:hypothetical protein
VFAYQDERKYLAYRLNAQEKIGEMVQCRDGQETVLTRREVEIEFSEPIRIKLEMVGTILEVHLGHEVEYTVNLDERPAAGKLGVCVGANGSATYEFVTIERATR